jgi:hypothetical protein
MGVVNDVRLQNPIHRPKKRCPAYHDLDFLGSMAMFEQVWSFPEPLNESECEALFACVRESLDQSHFRENNLFFYKRYGFFEEPGQFHFVVSLAFGREAALLQAVLTVDPHKDDRGRSLVTLTVRPHTWEYTLTAIFLAVTVPTIVIGLWPVDLRLVMWCTVINVIGIIAAMSLRMFFGTRKGRQRLSEFFLARLRRAARRSDNAGASPTGS